MIYNRIPVVFGNLRKITIPPVSFQYDIVQKLIISGLELPEYYQVDFCNEGDSESITMVGTSDGVDVPDQFLQTGKTVKAYLVLTGTDEGAVETRYEITIPVNKRPTRTDIEPTPVEQSTIDSLIAAMNDAVDDAEASATAAEGFAENAEASAERAEQAAQSIDDKVTRAEAAAQAAETAATRAEDAEDAANLFASNAAESAEVAHLSEVSAEGSASTATTKAAEASQSASEAAASAASTEVDAQEAEQAAQQAETSANAASQSATAAHGSATAASGSATVATNKAAEASAFATTATEKATEAANSATAAQTAKTGAEAAQAASEAAQQAAEEAAQEAQTILVDKAPVITDTASGAIASFPDGADGLPLKRLAASIDPVQSGSGDPSPDNIRPISGWTGLEGQRTGVNVCEEVWEDGYISATGGLYSYAYAIRSKNFNKCKPGTSYCYKHIPTMNGCTICWYDVNKNFIARVSSDRGSGTVTSPDNAYYFKLSLYNYKSQDAQTYKNDISINYPSTDTEYHAYTGESISVSWQDTAGTVYGGNVTISEDGSCKLTVDKYLYVYDGTEPFSKSVTALNGFFNQLATWSDPPHNWPNAFHYGSVLQITDERSSMFEPTRNVNTYRQNYGYVFFDSGHNFSVPPETFGTTVESFKAKLAELYAAGTPVSVFCKIATPQTYTLPDATMLTTVLGTNNIWVDTGDVEVEYRADTKRYIDKKIAEIINS